MDLLCNKNWVNKRYWFDKWINIRFDRFILMKVSLSYNIQTGKIGKIFIKTLIQCILIN